MDKIAGTPAEPQHRSQRMRQDTSRHEPTTRTARPPQRGRHEHQRRPAAAGAPAAPQQQQPAPVARIEDARPRRAPQPVRKPIGRWRRLASAGLSAAPGPAQGLAAPNARGDFRPLCAVRVFPPGPHLPLIHGYPLSCTVKFGQSGLSTFRHFPSAIGDNLWNVPSDEHERTLAFAEIALGQIKALAQAATAAQFRNLVQLRHRL